MELVDIFGVVGLINTHYKIPLNKFILNKLFRNFQRRKGGYNYSSFYYFDKTFVIYTYHYNI